MELLQHGTPFARAGLVNALEPDVFGWYLVDWNASVRDGVREVVVRMKEYDPSTLQVSPEETRDLLKDLYQGLLPRPLRHALGQYFTPDWLATLLLDRVGYDGDPDARLVDPACGTGTFLVLAISRLTERIRRRGVSPREMLDAVLRNVVGFDIDPLAALASRTNYVLALGSLVQAARGRNLDIPIYRADSMVGPTLQALQAGDRLMLETEAGRFSLPPAVDTENELRTVCDLAVEGLDEGWADDEYAQRAGRACQATKEERDILIDFFRRCRDVHSREIDGLWPRLLRNAFMPAFVDRFDLVVGNPPWVNWEHLPGSYRARTRSVWEDSGLFVHGGMASMLGAGKKDVSMLMSYVMTDRLLVEGGRLGFVVPETLFKTAGAGQGFRAFRIGKSGPHVAVDGVDDMVDLNPFVGAANRTALMTWRRDSRTQYPVAYRVWQRVTGGGISEDSTADEIVERTRRLDLAAAPVSAADHTSAWLAAPANLVAPLKKLAQLGEPSYVAHEGVNSGGANGVYWLSIDGEADHDGRLPVSNLHDVGKREVPKCYGRVETELVHPLLRGSDISRWCASPSAHILFLQDPVTRQGIDERRMQECYSGAKAFIARFEPLLRSRAAYKRYFAGGEKGAPFWSMFNVGSYTLADHKVVWKDQAADFAAAVLSTDLAQRLTLPNHKVILVSCESADEAHFICGTLNSTPARLFVASYAVETQIATHPMKYLRVARFNPAERSHAEIVRASRAAHQSVSRGEEPDERAVDTASAKLWGLAVSDVSSMRGTLDQLLKRDLRAEVASR